MFQYLLKIAKCSIYICFCNLNTKLPQLTEQLCHIKIIQTFPIYLIYLSNYNKTYTKHLIRTNKRKQYAIDCSKRYACDFILQ